MEGPETTQIDLNGILGYNWPLECMIFDVEQHVFWPPEWSDRPTDSADAVDICKREFLCVPKLIPIYVHRYIPEQRRIWKKSKID